MNICLVYGDYPPKPAGKQDGGADFVRILADRLASCGSSVTVIVSARDDRLTPFVTATGVRVQPLISDWSLRGALGGQLRLLRNAIKVGGFDVVHLIYPDPYLRYGGDRYHLPFLLRLAGAKRLVITFFGFGITGAGVVTKAGLALLFLSAGRIVITDYALLRRFQRTFAFWKHKSRSGFVGSISEEVAAKWSLAALARRRAELGLPTDRPLIGFFGFWSPDKGLEDLFAALHALKEAGSLARLVLVGGREEAFRTDYERTILDRIRELDLGGSVLDTGPLSAAVVTRYLLAVDVCVLPFRVNPLGRSSLALALKLAVPTIVTRPPVGQELLGRVALVEPRDPEGLATAIRSTLEDPVAQQRASDDALAASAHWSWDVITEAYVRDYQDLLRS